MEMVKDFFFFVKDFLIMMFGSKYTLTETKNKNWMEIDRDVRLEL